MPMHDFDCEKCGYGTEEIVSVNTNEVDCPRCGCVCTKVYRTSPPILTTIIPSYSTCKKHKAGYVHSHGDKPRTKTQGIGWSGADK